MRSITAVTPRLDQFTEVGSESGALLLKRMDRKCGSARKVEKPVYVCVVPHVDAKLCPIVHIASALGQVDPPYELFAEGFTHKPGQDYVSFATNMVQRRYIALLCGRQVAPRLLPLAHLQRRQDMSRPARRHAPLRAGARAA